MKKSMKFTALLMIGVMILSLCSCSGESVTSSSDDSGSITRVEEDKSVDAFGGQEETDGNKPSDASEAQTEELMSAGTFSDDALGAIFQLMRDVMGTDQETAEKMIGEYFDVELKDVTGHAATDERDGIITRIHSYVEMFSKDSVRFNGMEIFTDIEDGRVRRVQLKCTNQSYLAVAIEDTQEFRDEIKKLNSDMNEEMKKALGEPIKTDIIVWDEDSVYYQYQISDKLLTRVEIRDFTEPDGNGLMSTSVIFADCDVLLY